MTEHEVEYTHVARCQHCGTTQLTQSGSDSWTVSIDEKNSIVERFGHIDMPLDHECEFSVVDELNEPETVTYTE